MRKLDAPVIGVREWRIGRDGVLKSTKMSGQWKERTESATCAVSAMPGAPRKHNAPASWCDCGLYAFYDFQAVRSYGDCPWKPPLLTRNWVYGVVSGWGRVIPAEIGFRASHMRVEAIIAHTSVHEVPSRGPTYPEVAERYGIALIKPEEVYAFIALSGGTVMEPTKIDWRQDIWPA